MTHAEQVERFLAAVREDRAEDAERLLHEYPEIASSDVRVACVVGDDAAVAAALACDPGAVSRNGVAGEWPLLLYAAASPFHERDGAGGSLARVATQLLDAGASANTYILWKPEDAESRLPALYFAAERGNAAVVRVLLERGAEPNDGESIYHAAQFDRRECLELLLAHGADVSGAHRYWGNTPLYFLIGHREGAPGTERADRGIRWLLEHGADPEVTSGPHDETPLHAAARCGRGRAMIELLVAHGADPSRPRRDDMTPYALALRHGHAETALALADAGANTGAVRDADRWFAAIAAGDARAARELLVRTPDLAGSLGEEAGRFVADLAERAEPAGLILALELGLPVDGMAAAPDTPLHHAAWHGRPDNVRVLLERGVRVNVRDAEYGCSALAWACHGSTHCRDADDDYILCVDRLADAGADRTTAINRWGAGPERSARPAVARRLAERGLGAA